MTKKPFAALIADSHLRRTQYGSVSRGGDFLKAVLNAITAAHSLGIKVMLHTGDLLDTNRITGIEYYMLREIHAALKSKNMRMLAITGNHDISDPPWHSQLFDDAQHSIESPGLHCVDNTTFMLPLPDSVKYVAIHGIPYMTPEALRTYLSELTLNAQQGGEPDYSLDAIMWHGLVKEFAGFGADNAITAADFAACKVFKNVLLGDIHKWQWYALRPDGGCIGYPGSTEMCKSDEPQEKFMALLYQLEDGSIIPEPYTIQTRPFLLRQVVCEASMNALVGELQMWPTALKQPPVVITAFASGIEQFRKRLEQAAPTGTLILDPKVIVSSTDVAAGLLMGAVPLDPLRLTHPADLLLALIPSASSAQLGLMQTLARNPTTADVELRQFVSAITTPITK